MINVHAQQSNLISLSALARRLPAGDGKTLNPATTFRWATSGLRGHKLETVRIGGRFLTTWAAYEQFAAAVANGPVTKPTPVPAPQPRRVRDAKRILAEAGII